MSPPAAGPEVLTVLLYAAVAALVAAFGPVPFYFRDRVPPRWVGWSYALASGMMLGAVYVLTSQSLISAVGPTIAGAALGVGYTYGTHVYSGTAEMETRPEAMPGTDYTGKFILLGALHSASEGVAIGVAMVVDLRLGGFVALALATHNVAEAIVLTDVLRSAGSSLHHAAGLCVTAKIPQILLAVVAFAVTPAVPGLTPWVLGFASGAMIYLVMTELLPASYERAGRTSIAVLVSMTAGGVVLLKGLFVQ